MIPILLMGNRLPTHGYLRNTSTGASTNLKELDWDKDQNLNFTRTLIYSQGWVLWFIYCWVEIQFCGKVVDEAEYLWSHNKVQNLMFTSINFQALS